MQTPATEHELLTALLLWIRAHGAAERIVAASGEALALEVADRVIAEYRLAAERTTLSALFVRHARSAHPLFLVDRQDDTDAARVLLTIRGTERLAEPGDRAVRRLVEQTLRTRILQNAVRQQGETQAAFIERRKHAATTNIIIHHPGNVSIGENRGVVAGSVDAPGHAPSSAPKAWWLKTMNDNLKAVLSVTAIAAVIVLSALAALGMLPGLDGASMLANLFGLPK